MKQTLNAVRTSERELCTARLIQAPKKRVYEAWTQVDLFRQWWVPRSAPIVLESCELDVRVGGRYHLVFSMGEQVANFFGRYLEVVPGSRLVWTNEEGGLDAATVTTVLLEEADGATWVTVTDLYPSKESLNEAVETGSSGALPEQLEQLEAFMTQVSGKN